MATLTVGIKHSNDDKTRYEACDDGTAGQLYSVVIDLAAAAADLDDNIELAVRQLGISRATGVEMRQCAKMCAGIGLKVQYALDHP